MSHKVAVSINIYKFANSTEINPEVLVDVVRNMQELEENETGIPHSWEMAKLKVIEEFLEEFNTVKEVLLNLEEPNEECENV